MNSFLKRKIFDGFIEDIKSFGTIYNPYKKYNNIEEERKNIIIKPKFIINIPKEIKGNKNITSIYLALKKIFR